MKIDSNPVKAFAQGKRAGRAEGVINGLNVGKALMIVSIYNTSLLSDETLSKRLKKALEENERLLEGVKAEKEEEINNIISLYTQHAFNVLEKLGLNENEEREKKRNELI